MKKAESSSELDSSRTQSSRSLGGRWAVVLPLALGIILGSLARRKRTAFLIFLLCLCSAVAAAFFRGYSYRTTASLLLSPPSYQVKGPSSEFMPPLLDVPSYGKLMMDDEVLQQVCQKLIAQDRDLWTPVQDRELLAPEALRKSLSVSTEVIEKTPQSVRYSSVITLTAKSDSAERAKQLMDAWCDVSVRKVREITRPGLEITVKFIRDEYENARNELATKEKALSDFQAKNNLSMMQKLRFAYQAQLADYTISLSQLAVDIARLNKELEKVRELVPNEKEVISLKRSPSNDALTVAQSLSKISPQSSGLPTFTDEIPNTVFLRLREQETTLLADLDGKGAQRAKTQEELARLTGELEVLNGRHAALRVEEDRLQRDVSASKTYYDLLAKQREDMTALEANLKTEQGSCIIVANAPVLPSRPHNRAVLWAYLVVGLIIATLAAAVSTLLMDGVTDSPPGLVGKRKV